MDNHPQSCNDGVRLERDPEYADSLATHLAITAVHPQINVASLSQLYDCTLCPSLMSTLASGTYFMGLNSACP